MDAMAVSVVEPRNVGMATGIFNTRPAGLADPDAADGGAACRHRRPGYLDGRQPRRAGPVARSGGLVAGRIRAAAAQL
ncbi:hypothetical protein G6F57_023692 [Rhizopus arrhizus]|nr:hypothetical protein G6F57_023692 [Rhizopus arrhizus]